MPDQFALPNLESKEEEVLLLCATARATKDAL